MSRKPMPVARCELLADIDQRIAELRAAVVAESAAELARWIVLSGHMLPLGFTVGQNGEIRDAENAGVSTATRFHRTTATRLAEVVRDGTGKHGIAMRLDNAYAEILSRTQQTRDLIAGLEAVK